MKKIIKFLKEWSELLLIPLGFVIFYYAPFLLRKIDETAGGYDIGQLLKIIKALVFMLCATGFGWLSIKLNLPNIFRYGDNGFENDYNSITPWQKIKVYLFVSSFSVFLFVVLLITA